METRCSGAAWPISPAASINSSFLEYSRKTVRYAFNVETTRVVSHSWMHNAVPRVSHLPCSSLCLSASLLPLFLSLSLSLSLPLLLSLSSTQYSITHTFPSGENHSHGRYHHHHHHHLASIVTSLRTNTPSLRVPTLSCIEPCDLP